MATIEEFESMLKEVVTAKRLSASKMGMLTDVSMKLMENDTQLVSILYRTHKSLRASAKISSLYVFDAICRAARSQVIKRNLSGDINTEKGDCATFLLKIDSVLDGLFQDVLSSGIPEAKEKTRKILDIWTKSNTFPANILTRLGKKVVESSESSSKESKHSASDTPTSTSDPRKQPTPPNVITPPPAANSTTPTAEAAQAALLALLTTAAGANKPLNTNPLPGNIPSIPPPYAQSQAQLGQLQLALLQQLSKNNNGISGGGATGASMQNQAAPISGPFMTAASPFPAQLSMVAGKSNIPGPSSISPVNSSPYTYPDRDPRSNRNGNTHNGNGRSSSNARGGYRGGYRGRGRGDFRGPNDQGREPPLWDRESSTYHEGPPQSRRRFSSRSRSPPPRRRDDGSMYSPPRQSSLASPVDRTRAAVPGVRESGKDEFGREIRANSEESGNSQGKSEDTVMRDRESTLSNEVPSDGERHVDTPSHSFDSVKASNSSAIGLASFDISTFDPTSANSWKALGNAFQDTYGYMPSQEEMMQFVMTSMMGMGMGMNTYVGAEGIDAATGLGVSEASFGNAEGKIEGPGSSAGTYDGSSYGRTSDVVVLGPSAGDSSLGEGLIIDTSVVDASTPPTSAAGAGSSGGKMQRIGDGWKFIRDGV